MAEELVHDAGIALLDEKIEEPAEELSILGGKESASDGAETVAQHGAARAVGHAGRFEDALLGEAGEVLTDRRLGEIEGVYQFLDRGGAAAVDVQDDPSSRWG